MVCAIRGAYESKISVKGGVERHGIGQKDIFDFNSEISQIMTPTNKQTERQKLSVTKEYDKHKFWLCCDDRTQFKTHGHDHNFDFDGETNEDGDWKWQM